MIFTGYNLINEKYLTEFLQANDFWGLVEEEYDCIWTLEDIGGGDGNYLNDLDRESLYALSLNDAVFIPSEYLNNKNRCFKKNGRSREGLRVSSHANSIVTSKFEFFSDSFTCHRLVNGFFDFLGGRKWAPLEEIPFECVEENVVFLGLLCNHFGHALVDLPARLWFFRRFLPELLKLKFKFAFFPTHGLTSETDKLPEWLNSLCVFFDIPLDKVLIIDRPVSFKRAIIPKRVSPYLGGGGDFKLFKDAFNGGEFPRKSSAKIFLSRSGLRSDARSLNEQDQKRLEEFFVRQGFCIIHSQDFDLKTQIHLIRNASHIAGLAGSQLHLALFCSGQKIKMFKIAPEGFNLPIDRMIMRLVGGEYSQFVVKGQGDGHRSEWNIPEQYFSDLESKVLQWLQL